MTEAAAEAERNVVDVATLISADRRRLLESQKANTAAFRLFEMLPMMPRFAVEKVKQELSTSYPTANKAVKMLTDLGTGAMPLGHEDVKTTQRHYLRRERIVAPTQ